MKPLFFVGASRDDLRAFPTEARRAMGFDLFAVQHGLDPRDWKPMKTVGPGVREIRVRVGGAFRVIYLAQRPEAVYVLHAFEKKSAKTSRQDIELARNRLKQIGG
ncbi:MAG TPA: type II toxin-antitoxin system RelE/ParE family toxin [Nevskiales bacterium]|nr:type II toxin-antitoxin system RelE/ParE family toxin [Nevskiales bacterium]